MTLRFEMLACILLTAIAAAPQTQEKIDDDSPRGVVQKLWNQIESGSLATDAGLKDASSLFTNSTPREDANWIIYSDDFSVSQRLETTGNTATVEVGYREVGVVDQRLRFTPAPDSPYQKTSLLYHVVRSEVGWRIAGAPARWLTVRAAIPKLEKSRASTNDPEIKANAARSITLLKHRH